MEIVYSAANNLEAHMIKGMLEQQSIPAYIQGEHLQSGIGELPAISGFVKISVDNANVIAAKKIIKEWEKIDKISEARTEISNHSLASSNKNYIFSASIISFILGAISMNVYIQKPEIQNGIDINRDGISDITWTYKNNQATKSESDFNTDGKIDNIGIFDKGLLIEEKSDANFDGYFETENFYSNEIIYYSKSDFNNDREIDTVVDYEPNGDFKTSIFNPKTKLIKKVQFYKNQHLASAELDTNDDGKMDVLVNYNFYEEEISRTPINQQRK